MAVYRETSLDLGHFTCEIDAVAFWRIAFVGRCESAVGVFTMRQELTVLGDSVARKVLLTCEAEVNSFSSVGG